MNISLILDILILVVLLYIAYKLYAIASALSHFLERTARDRESREPSPAGQTINVNVAPVPGGVASGASATIPLAVSSAASQDLSGGASSQSSSNAFPPESTEPERKAAPSGPFAVKCSRCHAENSSYRTECFNCGNPL
jgi:hypothetical protein